MCSFFLKCQNYCSINMQFHCGILTLNKKAWELTRWFNLQPELFVNLGIEPPKGVLLFGPPGTGKTLCARAVANRTDACFIRVIGSELVQKYVGEVNNAIFLFLWQNSFLKVDDTSPSIGILSLRISLFPGILR